MADEYPNGKPPNLRSVKCCNSCKHVECGYEGERSCTKFKIRHDWMDEYDAPLPLSVDQDNLCDAHEERDGAKGGESRD